MKKLLNRIHLNHQFVEPRFVRALEQHNFNHHDVWHMISPTANHISFYKGLFTKRVEWPLLQVPNMYQLSENSPGKFGNIRKHDRHTGVDLYCEAGDSVIAIEDGVVVGIENFTGPNADDPSPWWNDTKAILVEGRSGVIVYGEVEPDPFLRPGCLINSTYKIGTVVPVLKEDKGKPMSMLHVELYLQGTRKTVWWKHGEPKPRELLDPTELLRRSAK